MQGERKRGRGRMEGGRERWVDEGGQKRMRQTMAEETQEYGRWREKTAEKIKC